MHRPFFIVGCSRSGTTLLSVLLDRHSKVAVTPETAFYDEIAPRMDLARGDVEGILGEWRRLPELGLDVGAVVARSGRDPTAGRLLEVLLALYAEKRAKPHCGEKTPQHLFHVPRIVADFPDARILCLVRDGRDVALSLAAMPWWSGGLAAAAAFWLKATECMEEFKTRYPRNFVALRYEELATEPETTLTETMKLLELDFEPAQLGPGPSNVVQLRSVGWKGASLAPVDATQVGRRQREASAEDIAALQTLIGPTLARLGYSL